MSAYYKGLVAAIVAVLIAGVTAWQAASADGMTAQDWATVALAVLGAIGVYAIPNVPAD
jgi:hypothetical protein